MNTTMNNRRSARIPAILAGMLLLSALAAPGLIAQTPGKGETFSFGPPLRNGILFFYTYTERVKTWVMDKSGAVQDSSQRILTYYISQRQTDAEVGGGAKSIEANIDSMHLDYRGVEGDVSFNTQSLTDVNDLARIRHRAVLVPSTLVNSVSHFIISPYGGLIRMESDGFQSIRDQGQDPMLDDFTQKRIEQMITDEYLSTVFLPWRNVVPFGQRIEFNKDTRVPFIAALDRVVFADSATVTLQHGEKDANKPTLLFRADLSNPKTEWVTWEGHENPVLLSGGHAMITGGLELDQDGVVLGGWSSANGTVTGSARGKELSARFEHQTYIELITMKASPVN